MAAILARFEKEIKIMLPYFATFATSFTAMSGAAAEYINYVAAISGQYTDLLANTSGLWKTKYDLNNP